MATCEDDAFLSLLVLCLPLPLLLHILSFLRVSLLPSVSVFACTYWFGRNARLRVRLRPSSSLVVHGWARVCPSSASVFVSHLPRRSFAPRSLVFRATFTVSHTRPYNIDRPCIAVGVDCTLSPCLSSSSLSNVPYVVIYLSIKGMRFGRVAVSRRALACAATSKRVDILQYVQADSDDSSEHGAAPP